MDQSTKLSTQFSDSLLRWFDHHGRKSLPWQRNRDPYGIWVAEIMLQQTQVSTVIPYYQNFMARLPGINSLAQCNPDKLLHYWSGLGYYARARNMHAAAKIIVAQHHGRFPDQFDQVLALPGIGRSTAGAILAFAWNQHHPILDGNVKRVLTRYYAIAGYTGARKVESRLWQIADQLTPDNRVADYTQAIMDLGSTVCTRTGPSCESCPLVVDCQAFSQGSPTAFPQRKPKAARPRKSVTMLVLRNPQLEVLLVKRPPSGIWGGLWSLPEFNNTKNSDTTVAPEQWPAVQWCKQQFGYTIDTSDPLPVVRHSFTHFDLDILPLPATLTTTSDWIMDADRYLWYNPLSPAQIGLPTAVNQILGPLDEPQGNVCKTG